MLFRSSHIKCPSGETVSMADLSFITTGQTWYESIIPDLQIVGRRTIDADRARIQQTTWREVGADLLAPTNIDISAPGSALSVLRAIKADHDNCWFFSENMTKLMGRSGVETFNGTDWKAIIAQPASPRRLTHRAQRTGSTRITRSRRSNSILINQTS